MASYVFKGIDIIKSHFSLSTTIDKEVLVPFLEEIPELEFINGLAFVDDEGI